MEGFLRRMKALIHKEFLQLFRDSSSLLLGIVLPIILILIIGYGISLDVKNVPSAVVLEDTSPLAQDAVSFLNGSDYFSPTYVTSQSEAEQMLIDRKVNVIIDIPPDFSTSLYEGRAKVQVILDGVETATAMSTKSYVESSISTWLMKKGLAGNGGITVASRMWFNDANSSTWFFIPGLIMLIMTIVGVMLTSVVMAREWERGTFESLFVTPVKPMELVLAKMVPYFCVALLGMGICLVLSRFLFEVPIEGSLIAVILISMVYLLVALGMGLVISAITKKQFVDPLLQPLWGKAVNAAVELHIFNDRHIAVKRKFLGHVADIRPGPGPRLPEVHSRHRQESACLRQEAAEHFEGGGLSGAVRPQEAKDFSLVHFEGRIGHRREIAEFLHQVLHLDIDFRRRLAALVQGFFAFFRRRQDALFRLPEKDHETVFQLRRRRAHFHMVGSKVGHRVFSFRNKVDFPAPGHRIHHVVHVVQEVGLENPRGHPLFRGYREAAARRDAAQVLRTPVGQHVALVEHVNFGCHFRFVHVGGAHKDRQVLILHKLPDDFPKLPPGQGIHPHRRFIQEQKVRRPDEGAGKAQLLLHAAGKLAGEAAGEPFEAHHFQKFLVPGRPRLLRHPVEVGVEVHIFLDREIFIETELLGHVGNAALDLLGVLHAVFTQHREAAIRRIHEPRNEAHEGGLPGAIWADDRRELPPLHRKVDMVQGGNGTAPAQMEGFMQFFRSNHFVQCCHPF